MRSKLLLPAAILAALLTAATASAQTIAYINFLQFDLQSFRSQATAGIFQDDVDMVADAANLASIEGNRLFTNFSNLNDPATLGDNILTYSLDHTGQPSASDLFDTGAYLVGWIGQYDQDSDYSFSGFYQRNSTKSMFEDLDDLNIGFVGGSDFDAEYSGFTRTTFHDDSTGAITADQLINFDLMRYDQRSAMNLDLGAARDISEELTFGGRIFWENDQMDSFSEGEVETVNRTADSTGALNTTSRSVQTWIGNGEEAFKQREIGVSLDADYHPWDNQDVNIRLDVFGAKLVNPSPGLFFPSRGYDEDRPYEDRGERVNLRTVTNYSTVNAGTATAGGTDLAANHEASNTNTNPYSYFNYNFISRGGPVFATESIDDERTGIGFAAKGQWDREWAGGENRAWVGFGSRSLDIDATLVLVERNTSTFWWNGGSGDREATITNLDDTVTISRSGDMKLNVLEAGSRWERALNQHVSMGLGAILTRETWTDDYQETGEEVQIFGGFDDGDPGVNALYTASGNNPAYNEERTVFEEMYMHDIKDEVTTTFVRLPVGAQFHFKDRWTVNVGAQHMIANSTRETTATHPASGNGPGTTTYTDIGGAGTPPSPNPEYDSEGFEGDQTITDKIRENKTTYWYGLSVMITDAAQLDINGFFDTHSFDDSKSSGTPDFGDDGQITDVDFFRNLAISLKYIFW